MRLLKIISRVKDLLDCHSIFIISPMPAKNPDNFFIEPPQRNKNSIMPVLLLTEYSTRLYSRSVFFIIIVSLKILFICFVSVYFLMAQNIFLSAVIIRCLHPPMHNKRKVQLLHLPHSNVIL